MLGKSMSEIVIIWAATSHCQRDWCHTHSPCTPYLKRRNGRVHGGSVDGLALDAAVGVDDVGDDQEAHGRGGIRREERHEIQQHLPAVEAEELEVHAVKHGISAGLLVALSVVQADDLRELLDASPHEAEGPLCRVEREGCATNGPHDELRHQDADRDVPGTPDGAMHTTSG